MRSCIPLLTAILLFSPVSSGAQAGGKSVERQLASLSEDLSKPSQSLEAKLRMAQLLERIGATRAYPEEAARPSSANYYLTLLRDTRTGDSELLPEILDGWERTLELEISSPHKISFLTAWVEEGTPIFASETDRGKYRKADSSNVWHVFDIANGRALLRRQRPGEMAIWVRLKGVELRVQEARRHTASTLRQFELYLGGPPAHCCLEELEEIERIRDDLAYAHYGSEVYLERFPNGRHSEKALASRERGAFLEVSGEHTDAGKAAAYRDYLQEYPDGTYAEEAEKELRKMELSAFNAAKQSNLDGVYREYLYREYLQEYPDGEYANIARQEIAQLRALGRCENGNLEKCHEFLRQFPESEHRTAIERYLENTAYQAALASGTVAGYQAFLDKHPSGSQSDQAREELAKLQAAQALASASTEDEFWWVSIDYTKTEEGSEARKRAERLGFQRAKELDDLITLSEYLNRYSGESYRRARWISARRNYHLARSSGAYRSYCDFLEGYQADIGALSDAEESDVVGKIAMGADEAGDFRCALLLAARYKSQKAFKLAENLARSSQEKIDLIRVNPHKYLKVQMWNMAGQQGLRGSVSAFGDIEWVSANLTIPVFIAMGSEWGTPVRVRIVATVSLEYEVERRGVFGAPSRRETKKEVVERWARVGPGEVVEASFVLGRRRLKDERGTWLIGGSNWTLTDIIVPKIEFAEIKAP